MANANTDQRRLSRRIRPMRLHTHHIAVTTSTTNLGCGRPDLHRCSREMRAHGSLEVMVGDDLSVSAIRNYLLQSVLHMLAAWDDGSTTPLI